MRGPQGYASGGRWNGCGQGVQPGGPRIESQPPRGGCYNPEVGPRIESQPRTSNRRDGGDELAHLELVQRGGLPRRVQAQHEDTRVLRKAEEVVEQL